MNRRDRQVLACPECDSPSLSTRPGGINSGRATDDHDRYYCTQCNARFETPTERAAKTTRGGIRGDSLAARLAKANPDEVTSG
jgi:transposase-like protein